MILNTCHLLKFCTSHSLTLSVIMVYFIQKLTAQLCVGEVINLFTQLSEQRSKLEAMCSHIQQDVHFKKDITQLLKQANTNIVRFLHESFSYHGV